jgi:hypothetical protein
MWEIVLEGVEFSVKDGNRRVNRDWSFSPGSVLDVVSFIGQGNPESRDIDTVIRDIIFWRGTEYDQYYVKINIVHPVLNGVGVEWLTVSGDIVDAGANGYLLSQENLDVVTQLTFNALNMQYGSSYTRLNFDVYGKTAATDSLFHLEQRQYSVQLRRLNSGSIYVAPSDVIEWSHIRSGNVPIGVTRRIYALGEWQCACSGNLALSGGNLVLNSDHNGYKRYTGSGIQDITITLLSAIDDETNTIPYYYEEVLFAVGGGAVDVQGVRVYVYDSEEKNVSPLALNFEAVIGFSEASNQPIYVTGSGTFTVEGPSWMQIPFSSNDNNTTIWVKPELSNTFTPGTYQGVITINHGGEVFEVQIEHRVYDGITTGYDPINLNFTKDIDILTLVAGSDMNIAVFDMSMVGLDYGNLEVIEAEASFEKSLYKSRASLLYGDKIEKAMASMSSISFLGFQYGLSFPGADLWVLPFKIINYYNPVQCRLQTSIRNRDTGVQDVAEVSENVQYVKGRRPDRYSKDVGIIDYNNQAMRVTQGSKALLNIYRNKSVRLVKVFRNGVEFTRIYPDAGDYKLFGLLFTFEKFTQGDVIDLEIAGFNGSTESAEMYSQRYIMFPEGKHSYHILWENEHGLCGIMEFTGDYILPVEYESVISKGVQTLKEYTIKSDTKVVQKFIANTGWVLKADYDRLDSLSRSRKAWVIFGDESTLIELVPITDKLKNADSDQELFSYELEFEINSEHEYKTYTR